MINRFTFALAGTFAPLLIRRMIERYRMAPEAKRGEKPLLYVLLGDGTPAYKFDKMDVAYTDNAASGVPTSPGGPETTPYRRGQTCNNCQSLYLHVTTETLLCDQVRGVIAGPGWCDRWRPPWPTAEYQDYQEVGRRALEGS